MKKAMHTLETDFPLHLFHHGENFKTYELMGAHPMLLNKKQGYMFRVWAPHASAVSVVGEFNGWDENAHPMKKMIDHETFELFIPGVKEFDLYKYCIFNKGEKILKADPYAFHTETPGVQVSNGSKLYDLNGFKWSDDAYLTNRKHINI